MKGTDASWKDDQETPAQFADYSDDESEQKSRKKNKNATYKPGIVTNTVPLNYSSTTPTPLWNLAQTVNGQFNHVATKGHKGQRSELTLPWDLQGPGHVVKQLPNWLQIGVQPSQFGPNFTVELEL